MGANVSFPEGSVQPGSLSNKPQAFSKLAQAYTVSDTDLSAKKKKASKFATLRKKLIRGRRHSRSLDYGKSLRDLVSSWSVRDLSALVQEYEALIALKEITISASLARPLANSFRIDLSHLFDYKFCTDVDLIYKGACFPAHHALLSARSPFFRDLLSRYRGYGSQIAVKLKTPGVDVALFAALLRYLYTDTINTDELHLENQEILIKLAEELGMPNPIDHDLHSLMESGDLCDAVLVFSSDSDLSDSVMSERGSSEALHRSSKRELPCHKAILAARSPFFRNLLLRRARSGEEMTERTLQTPSRIVLDESVIPWRYARVLRHAIYQDNVDLSLIMRGSASMCSLSEVQAIVAGKGQMTVTDEAMEIYQIGQFLDFSVLSQGCEDIITDSITVDNVVSILNWSSEPHGSKWVLRQALHFLREEFIQVANSPVLFELNKVHLIETLSSDFLQAGELDILTAVLKWGEHRLVRRIEEREPNLLNHTAHSISKKGVKRRDLNDSELREILAELLPLVRMDHVLPYNNEVLGNAVKRGLVSSPPSHMICDEGNSSCVSAWVRGKNSGMFVCPRLFTPYYEEVKSVLEEHLASGQDQEQSRVRPIHLSSIPDTLYMVEDRQCFQPMTSLPSYATAVDAFSGSIPVPDSNTLSLMMSREQEIQSSKQIQRALGLPCVDRRAIMYQIQLRVVREFGMPDLTVEVLKNSSYYHPQDPIAQFIERPQYVECQFKRTTPTRHKSILQFSAHQKYSSNRTKPVQCVPPMSPSKSFSSCPATEEPNVSPSSDVDYQNRSGTLSSTRSTLSDAMPDIAIASSSLSQVHLHDEFELDIGDGTGRHGTMYI
ncbi:hypothetical protein CHS0354_038932 [Potamilus streckersoni]|uniref:BTB domain-containing protein n=1 Tax=Potamilus streckersoni TaxID=2493646 RepID=A0AAE0VNG8_9BIVA|nr:hypothetical protein CHS0354_038932 [Potamilus streckersoni]